MRLIHLTKIRPGMLAARPVYGPAGQKLINAGTELKPHYIKYLRKLGISQVYIQDDRLEGVEVEDVIGERTRLEVRTAVKDIMTETKNSSSPRNFYMIEDRVAKSVDTLFNELIDNKNVVINLADIRSADSYTFDHSLNVTILSIIMATKLSYPMSIIKRNAIGFMLHDLGLVKVPEKILKKQGPLDKEEEEIVKKHPIHGYELFKKSSLFSESAGSIILQHHERLQGQGYPQGLKKEDMHWLAQIAAIADTYDALTSNRPFREFYRPHEALNMLSVKGGVEFNIDMLTAFFSFVAAYPIGTHVILSNGDSGLVIGNTQGYPYRPKVRVLYQGEKHPHPNPYEVDLLSRLDLTVRGEVLTEGE